MLRQAAARFGDDPAVTCLADGDADTHTFAELDAASDRVANGLRRSGAAGDPVAVLSHNSLAVVETLYAAWKVASPVVPVNARLDAAEVEYVLDDADPAALVADPAVVDATDGLAGLLGSRSFPTYLVDDGDGDDDGDGGSRPGWARPYADLADAPADPPDATVGPDAEDGYFYTSGSSGRPKGVVHRHGDRFPVHANLLAEWGIRHDDVNCNPLPLYHSGPLHTGLTPFVQFGVHTVTFRRFDPRRTLAAVERFGATVLGGVPAQYDRMVGLLEDGAEYDRSSLRFWWVSGAPLTEALARRCHEHLHERHSVVYGATEVGPPVSTLAPEDSAERPLSCGTGHMGQTVRVVDPDAGDPDAAVATGETGELVVRGASVMDRYLGRPGLTDEAVRDGWYFTGDLARRDDGGYLYVEGRKDDMIVTGGENVYPVEVENALATHPDVEDVAVVGVDDPEWGQSPKAFVVAAPDAELSVEAVVAHCRDRLADYKRPRAVAFVPEIPRDPSGGSVLKGELRDSA